LTQEGVSEVIFTAEAERRRGFDNQVFIPLRLSASAVKTTADTLFFYFHDKDSYAPQMGRL
jgi:hypothetical protein